MFSRRSTPPADSCRKTCPIRPPTGDQSGGRPDPDLRGSFGRNADPGHRPVREYILCTVAVARERRGPGGRRRGGATCRSGAGQSRSARGARISVPQVAALNSANTLEPTGNLEGRHEEFPIDINQQIANADQFRKVIIAYSNGAPVELKDIATVVDGPRNPRTGAWFGTSRPRSCWSSRRLAPTRSRSSTGFRR